MAGLEKAEEIRIDTPFGEPSDAYIRGVIGGRPIVFLARHGRGHRLLPTELNFRANIAGFKMLGVERLVSVSAVGSMKEELHPLDVVPAGSVHRLDAPPHRHLLRGGAWWRTSPSPIRLRRAARRAAALGRGDGRCACTTAAPTCASRGRSSRRAPSRTCTALRRWIVTAMTNAQEAKLSREAEICYATDGHGHRLRLPGRRTRPAVTVEEVVARLHDNAKNAERSSRATLSPCRRSAPARAAAPWPRRS
jgi:5'-methylthioadenosine phosphorylase